MLFKFVWDSLGQGAVFGECHGNESLREEEDFGERQLGFESWL